MSGFAPMSDGARRITHAVAPEKVRDLLESVPRACVVFTNAGVVEIVPVEFRLEEGRYWIGISGDESDPIPAPDQSVKLMIDDGICYFDMRGIWVRGPARFSRDRPNGGSPTLRWFRLDPEKLIAWDFGAMREVSVP